MAVYDLLSGARLGRLDVRSTPVEMEFAPDSPTLVVILQVHGAQALMGYAIAVHAGSGCSALCIGKHAQCGHRARVNSCMLICSIDGGSCSA